MQASCDIAFKYAHERVQFGEKIGMFQVKRILVNLQVQLCLTHLIWIIVDIMHLKCKYSTVLCNKLFL